MVKKEKAMKIHVLMMSCLAAALTLGAAAPAKAKAAPAKAKNPAPRAKAAIMEAENAIFDAGRMQIIDREKFSGKKGLMLADDQKSMLDNPDLKKPDAIFKFKIEKAGTYWIHTVCDTTGVARKAMLHALNKKNKYDSLQMKFTIDDGILRARYIVSPWEDLTYRPRNLMKWDFAPGEHVIKIWLPKDAGLDKLAVVPYNPPRVPEVVKKYQPTIIPGARPRLWVTPQTLGEVKANLTKGENKAIWEKVQAAAAAPFTYNPKKGVEGEFNAKLHDACIHKAFVYLMTGDKKMGQEAITLMDAYMGVVEFSNLLDITREIGQVIYSGSLVYDWCYDLLSAEQRKSFRAKLLRLAMDMEIGWPPFLQSIVNGHGNELQVNRDLLSMAIALYGDDNEPYRYCSYRILEELVPMRAEEYKSGRHNQGVSYAAFRFNAEMHAVWLMRRLANKEIFDPNIKSLGYYWTYGQFPDGRIMTDGDGSISSSAWAAPDVMFMCYTYSADPILKAEYIRQGTSMTRPVLFLLLNDPALKATPDHLNKLPLTRYFTGVLPSMIARTGWDISSTSNDVMVEMKGGDTHFGNHQHMDAGAFQIFHRGELATDLGMYGFYGTLYDMGYNKRSIAHNVMLAYDPTEIFRQKRFANDGGQRFIQEHPRNVREINKPVFRYGETLAGYVGPNKQRPFFSYLWSDLTQAYSDKVEAYTRAMCFVNLADQDCPAAMIVVDRMTTRNGIRKYWTVNSLTKPEETARGVNIFSRRDFMRGQLSVNMFLPREIKKEIAGGGKATSFFGQTLNPPIPTAAQAQGYRTMISDANEQDTALFAAVMLIGTEGGNRPAVTCKQNWNNIVFTIGDRIVVMPSSGKPQDTGFRFSVPAGKGKCNTLLAGLQTGLWNVCSLKDKKTNVEATVIPEEGTVFMQLEPGEYLATPGASADEVRYTAPEPAVPEVANRYADSVFVNGKKLADATPVIVGKAVYVPAIPVIKALGGNAVVSGAYLNVDIAGQKVIFKNDSKTTFISGKSFTMAVPVAKVIGKVWYIDGTVLAGFSNAYFLSDISSKSAIMQSRKTEDEILWLNSDCDFTREAWNQMQGTQAKGGYWATHGKGRWFEVTFRHAKKLDGIGINWSQGAARKARFKLEINDGKGWKTVYNGESYKKGDLEVYPFPAQEVRQIRWTGYGNTLNDWNSIFSFVPQVVSEKK